MSETEMDQAPIVLMELIEQNLKEMRSVAEDLAAERNLLERERQKLEFEVRDLKKENKKVVEAAIIAAAAKTHATIVDAIAQTEVMTNAAATQLLENLKSGAKPVLENLSTVTTRAATADAALRNVIKWASWRLLGLVAGVLVVLGVFGWLASAGVQWWDTKTIAQDLTEKDQLQQEIANLQANQAAWVQAGMQDQIQRCSPGNRPCVAVDESAGAFGTQGNLRVLQGY